MNIIVYRIPNFEGDHGFERVTTGFSICDFDKNCVDVSESVFVFNWHNFYKQLKIVTDIGTPKKILVDWSWEPGIDVDEIALAIEHAKTLRIPENRMLWLINKNFETSRDCRTFMNCYPCVTIDYFLQWCFRENRSTYIKNFDSAKGLCLTGSLDKKLWRLPILYSLWQRLDRRLVLSSLSTLPKMQQYPKSFQKFIKQSPPLNRLHTLHDNSSQGWPPPWKAYSNTQASFVIESEHPGKIDEAFITEKTYRTLFAGHAFVSTLGPQARRYLKAMGFDLYEHVIGEYDCCDSDELAEKFDCLVYSAAKIESAVKANQNLLDVRSRRAVRLTSKQIREWICK